ncbi:MAG: rhodanese-like domain-containing protein [Bacteroidetes bacterium]|nr:rhodanese-like domain-containing protein [Bacteroidota bacterium]
MKRAQVNECISIENTKQLLATKNQFVKIIDVRSREEFDLAHIPGAINIATLEIEIAIKLFDKSDYLITACGKGGGRSTEAAEKLKALGFKNAAWLCGGTFGWIENNK